MLASGAHISLGGYELFLDETVDAGSAVGNLYRPHYRYSTVNYFGPGQTIEPGQSQQNLRATRLMWLDDFSGGEGNRYWQPQDPTVYDFSYGLNGRIRGQLTVRPSRSLDTITTDAVAKPLHFASSHGVLFAGGGKSLSYYDGSSWTNFSATYQAAVGASSYITAMGSDPNRVVIGATDGTNRWLVAANKSNVKTLSAGSWTNTMFCGITSMHGSIYTLEWDLANTVKIFKYDTTTSSGYTYDSTNASQRKAVTGGFALEASTTVTEANFGTTWFAGATSGPTTVYFFVSVQGRGRVLKYDLTDGPSAIWSVPDGFTVRDIEFHNGLLYIIGHWGATSGTTGFGALFVYDPKSGDVTPVAEPGRSRSLNATLSVNAASYMNQSMFADGSNGRIWIYDADEDSVTMLDSIATSGGDGVTATDTLSFTAGTHSIMDMITFGNQRIIGIGGSGANYQILRYKDDETANRQAAATGKDSLTTLTTGNWDFDLPFQQKQLLGFSVTWDPTTITASGQTITIEYSIDNAAFVTAGTVTGGAGDAALGRTFIALSSKTSFTNLKFRITCKATGNTVLPPVLTGVAAEAQCIQQVWELIVRVKEPLNAQRSGTKDAMSPAETIRDNIRTLITNGVPVTFLDGYRYHRRGASSGYSTHTVTIEEPEDTVIRKGEGSMRLTLREV